VPSSRDIEELKRRLVEMEELLDGLATRLARAEAREDDDPGEGESPAEGDAEEQGDDPARDGSVRG
jgi:hypothetical protein